MATTPTQRPVPSEMPQDTKFNAGKIDEFVTSMGWTYTDRFGNKHYTIEGINYLAQQVMNAFGYITLTGVDFDTGATVSTPNEVLFNPADNSYYKWSGSFASGQKVVPQNSTPASSGGIGPGKWLNVGDTALRSTLASQTIPGASLIGLPNGTLNDAIKFVTPEMFGAKGDGATNDTAAWKACLVFAISSGLDIEGHGSYIVNDTLLIPQTANLPPVREDFTRMKININKITYTATGGTCIKNSGRPVQFSINELYGTANISGFDVTVGFELDNTEGRSPHYIGWVHGFGTGVRITNSFSNEIHIGFASNCWRGVYGEGSNENIIYGRIGGSFSGVAIDPSTCDVGVEWNGSCHGNKVWATIEYCRRTVNSKPFIDNGTASYFFGYSESCSTPGLLNGKNSEYKLFNGGNNVRTKFGFLVGGISNKFQILEDKAISGEQADDVNISLVNQYPQAIQSTTNQSEVYGNGHRELVGVSTVNQLLINSNKLNDSSWNLSPTGAANPSDLNMTFGVYNSGASNQYRTATRISASRVSSESDIYRFQQNVATEFATDISFGCAVRVNGGDVGFPGDVDFMLKVQGSSGVVYNKVFRLNGGSKIVEVSHTCPSQNITSQTYTFELSFRANEKSIIDVFNLHLCAAPNITSSPVGIGSGATPFQPLDKNGIHKVSRICKALNAPITLDQYDFDTYIIGAADGNITLSNGFNGQELVFYKNGASNTNLLSSVNIGGAGVYTFNADKQKLRIQYSTELNTWLII